MRHLGAPPVKVVMGLRDAWPSIVGPVLSEHSRPIEVIDGELTVACAASAWASQLRWMESDIKRQCANVLDGLHVDRVRVRVDRSGPA